MLHANATLDFIKTVTKKVNTKVSDCLLAVCIYDIQLQSFSIFLAKRWLCKQLKKYASSAWESYS